ncbi:hypothetical protein B296_00031486 [Ensete ventricosum]|uniref:Uncharacterized protein n=1 Tax=Ensete ventricosum TaxID=4639 RepID=A0A427AG38_ENSVE|nr:hypothetical protein B296_00031486 [Ensete ventricosum]
MNAMDYAHSINKIRILPSRRNHKKTEKDEEKLEDSNESLVGETIAQQEAIPLEKLKGFRNTTGDPFSRSNDPNTSTGLSYQTLVYSGRAISRPFRTRS